MSYYAGNNFNDDEAALRVAVDAARAFIQQIYPGIIIGIFGTLIYQSWPEISDNWHRTQAMLRERREERDAWHAARRAPKPEAPATPADEEPIRGTGKGR